MTFQFINVSPKDVTLNRAEVERDDGFVYIHLRRYCSKFTTLPAITVAVKDGRLAATRGYKYLSIAQELGLHSIRAVIQGITFDEIKRRGVPGLLSVVSQQELDDEQNITIITGWHIFFFGSCPPPEIAADIDSRFQKFLEGNLPPFLDQTTGLAIQSHFDFLGPCLEVRFPTPVANQEWADLFLRFILWIDGQVWPIETYQGRRFAPLSTRSPNR